MMFRASKGHFQNFIIKGDNEMSNLSKKEATEKAYELLDQFNYDVLGPEGSGKA